MIVRRIAIGGLLATLFSVAGAMGADSGAATEPATMPAPHKADVPPGFHIVTAGDRSAICQPQDDDWVKDVMVAVAPATRPTTMPSDVVGFVQQRRKELTSQMTQDLALGDQKALDAFFDGKLLPTLGEINALKPRVYYFIATREKVADLMDAGWTDPRFHYIRFAHDVSYSPVAMLTVEKPMDDLVWWVEIHDGDNAATRHDTLVEEIRYFEAELAGHISMFASNETEHFFEAFIHDNVFEPLKLPPRLDWFDFGVSNIFAIKYSATATGSTRGPWIEQLIGRPDRPRPYVRLDLLNALNPAEIRPEYVAAYDRALLPKAALVIESWLASAGDGALAKALPVLRSRALKTPQDLIDVVKQTTGYDLTPLMQPDFSLPPTRPSR
jgi:hypothetical protein